MNYTAPPDKQVYFEQVWELVRQVPLGRVSTYGQIAKLIPIPAGIDAEEYKSYASRWVGLAMAACPDGVPWQRVINSQGKISHRSDAGQQRDLLIAEGIIFIKGRLNLSECQWAGPGQDDTPRQGSLF